MSELLDLTFFCQRREMPVMKDTTDCLPCPLRVYPSPCPQYEQWRDRLVTLREPAVHNLYEPYRPEIEE